MKGWIFGNEKQLPGHKKSINIQISFKILFIKTINIQKHLRALLGLTDREVFSLIVFIGDSTFKTDMPPNVTEGEAI